MGVMTAAESFTVTVSFMPASAALSFLFPHERSAKAVERQRHSAAMIV